MNTYPGAVALTDGRHQQRGVGGAKAKALPARHQTGAIGACNDLIVVETAWMAALVLALIVWRR